jgi:hypothetical protein
MNREIFLKLVPQEFCSRSMAFPERKRITTENSVAARQFPLSSKGVY